MTASVATYLYCVVQSRDPTRLEAALADVPAGVDSTGPVRLLDAGGTIRLVVADAPLPQWSSETVSASLSDLDWVSRCALAHEAVIEHVMAHVDLLPVKLFTLYASDARALADLAQRRASIDDAFDRLAGAWEWGVRIARSDRTATPAGERERPSSGTEFLRRKREDREGRSRHHARAREHAERIAEQLEALATAAHRAPLPDDEAGRRVLVDLALLVPRDDTERLEKAVATAAATADVQVTLTGPWPPYHFVAGSA